LGRRSRYELILDELGPVFLAEMRVELLFQAAADHAEKASVNARTYRPFSERPQCFAVRQKRTYDITRQRAPDMISKVKSQGGVLVPVM
jgi:hypothetical protein